MNLNFRAIASAIAIVCASAGLTSCATNYGAMSMTGGYKDTELEPGIWRVGFYGNGYTTSESVQTYWLYHCAQLALEKGYDGFETVKLLKFSRTERFDRADIVRVRGGGGGHGGGHYVSGGYYSYSLAPKPYIVQDIRLLRKPFTPVPGRSFDAAALRETLDPIVNGKKCSGNVCPHVHRYLYPVPAGDKPSTS
jgi:hypothetical protein